MPLFTGVRGIGVLRSWTPALRAYAKVALAVLWWHDSLGQVDQLGRGSVKRRRRRSMSTEENKDLVRRLFDAINNQSLDEPDTLLDPDFRLNGEPVSLADFQEFVIWHASVLTELHISIEDIIAEGDKVVARLLRQGIHQGWLDVQPTG